MIRRVAATGAVILVLTILAVAPRAQVSADPRAFIGSLGARAIEVLGPSVPPQQRQARFRELLQNDFTSENMVKHLQQIVPDGEQRQQMLAGLAEVQATLHREGERPAV